MSEVADHVSIRKNKAKKYASVVGVNTSARVPTLAPLQYAESDAQGIGWLLRRQECNFIFPSPVLTSEEATTQRVRQAVIHLVEQRGPDDLLLFYFIGHSYTLQTDEDETDVYLVTADFDPHQAEIDPSAHLSLRWIRQMLLERNRRADCVIILDWSYAGNIQEYLRDFAASDTLRKQPDRSWAVITSIDANASDHDEVAQRGEGHTRMTALISDALGGNAPAALDDDGNVTLLSLHNYLQAGLAGSEALQYPGILASLPQRWVLASQPAENPVRRSFQDFASKPETPENPLATPEQLLFDESICQTATFADLDPAQIQQFLSKERVLLQDDYRAGLSDQEQMKELGLLWNDRPSYGALLCFGQQPSRQQVTGAYTRCIYWRDPRRLSGWIDDRELRGSLLEQFTQARDFLYKHLNFGRLIEREGSSEQPELPLRVLEEALVNALIHREYVTDADRLPRTEGVVVEIFSDRVEISSPGGPPAHMSLEALQNAQDRHPGSHPRNPQLMRLFYLAGHVEPVGTGVARMQQLMQEAGLEQPEFSFDQSTQTLVVTLPRPEQENELVVSSSQPLRSGALPITQLLQRYVPTASSSQPLRSGALSVPQVFQRYRFFWIGLSILLIVGIIIGSVSGIRALAGRSQQASSLSPASTVIEIATDFPTSGLEAVTGRPLQNGVQMAIDEANHNQVLPGYTFKLVSYNDVGSGNRPDPQAGSSNINKAITDNLVAGIIGPAYSSVAQAELPIANHAPIALLSPSVSDPCLTKSNKSDPNCTGDSNIQPLMRPTTQLTFFRLATTDDIQGKAAADYLFQTKHYQRVLLLKDDSDSYSFGLAQPFQNEWRRLGGLVIPFDLPEKASKVQDYQNLLQTVAATQPDLIYFAGNDPNGTYVLQALSNIPALKTVAFAGGDGILDSAFLQIAAQLHPSAPVYTSLQIQDPTHSGTSAGINFKDNYYANNYTDDYQPFVASAYDCAGVLIQAIRTALQQGVSTPYGAQDQGGAKRFRQAILLALSHLTYTGATGMHSFDPNGDTTNHTVSFYQVDLSTMPPTWTWLQQVSG